MKLGKLFSLEEHPSVLVNDQAALQNTSTIQVDNNLPDPTQVGEVVEASIEYEQFQHLDSEITKEIEIQEAHEEAATELAEVVQEQEQAIDQAPEQITEDNVRIAQECLAYSLGRLGMSFKEHKAQRLSVEQHGNYPVDKLRITVEGIKEIIDKIIEKIKSIFRRIGNFFRELYLKAVMLFDKTQKQAEYLLKVYAKGEVKRDISREDLVYINKQVPLLLVGGVDKAIANYKVLNDLILYGPDVYQTLIGKVSIVNQSAETVLKDVKDILEKLRGNQTSAFTNIVVKIKEGDVSKKATANKLVWQYTFSNGYSRLLTYNPETGNVDVENAEFALAVTTDENLEKLKAVLAKPLITLMLQDALTNSRNSKAFVEKVKKARDEASKGLEAMKKASNPTEDDKIRLKFISNLGGKIALDLISAYIKWNKGLVNIAEICLDRKTIDKGILNAAK